MQCSSWMLYFWLPLLHPIIVVGSGLQNSPSTRVCSSFGKNCSSFSFERFLVGTMKIIHRIIYLRRAHIIIPFGSLIFPLFKFEADLLLQTREAQWDWPRAPILYMSEPFPWRTFVYWFEACVVHHHFFQSIEYQNHQIFQIYFSRLEVYPFSDLLFAMSLKRASSKFFLFKLGSLVPVHKIIRPIKINNRYSVLYGDNSRYDRGLEL